MAMTTLVGTGILIPNSSDNIAFLSNLNEETIFEKNLKLTSRTISKLSTAYHSSVSIVNNDGRFIGAGTVLRRRAGEKLLVITAYHVVKDLNPNDVDVAVKETKFYRDCKLLRYDEEVDIAILEGIKPEEEHGPQAKLAKEDPNIGEELWVIGTPRAIERNVTRGVLGRIIKFKGKTLYRTDADIFFGNSGGGVFNREGRLVGLAVGVQVFTIGPFPSIIPGGGICVSIRHILHIVNEN